MKVQSRIIIEIMGKPKEHIEKTLQEYVEKIKKTEGIEVLETQFNKAKPSEDMWTTFVELELITKDLPTLIGFCFDYMPSSIDIIKPETLSFEDREMTNVLNDLQAKLHRVDMVAKKLANENQYLQQNMYSLLKNFVSILLLNSEKDSANLAQITGLKEDNLKKILDKMVEAGTIQKTGEKYTCQTKKTK